jgi:uncharacterized membrane protein YoaT (DUF817 family)
MVLLITKCLLVRETNVRFTQWSITGAYQVTDVTSFLRVGLLTFCAENVVSILNVSNVPALMVSWPATVDLPDLFQMFPFALLILLVRNVQVTSRRQIARKLRGGECEASYR